MPSPSSASASPPGLRPGRVAHAARPGPLSAAECRQFEERGFLVLPQRCGADELTAIRAMLRGLFARRSGHAEGRRFDMLSAGDAGGTGDAGRAAGTERQPQLLGPGTDAPALLQTAQFRHLQAVARQLLGDDAQFAFDHAILKPAGSQAATPWHQDEAHHLDPQFRFRKLSVWMPLQDTVPGNGCMQYLAGSNHGPVRPHRPAGGDPRVDALECDTAGLDLAAATVVPAAAGCCIAHDGRTVHAATANGSATDRLAYVVSFRSAPQPHDDAPRFEWLEGRRTARMQRRARWLRRGGFATEILRWLARLGAADPRGLWLRLCLRVRRIAVGWRVLRAPQR